MKILFISPSFPTNPQDFVGGGGVPHVAYNVAKELVRRGHKVDVYASSVFEYGDFERISMANRTISVSGINVNYFPYVAHYHTFYLSPNLVLFTRKSLNEYDIVHIHDFRSFHGVVASYYARKFKIPYVVQTHGTIFEASHGFERDSLKRVIDCTFGYDVVKGASMVVALSQLEVLQYECLSIPKEKAVIVPAGIDLAAYSSIPPKGSFKEKFRIPPQKKLILYLGRIHKDKGIEFLIKAYASLCKDAECSESVLVIAGLPCKYLRTLRSLVNFLGVTSKVIFTGKLSEADKISAYVDAAVCVYPGQFEAFGIVALESAVCGTPVIVSKGTPMANIIYEGKFGYAVKYGDIQGLAETMSKVIGNDNLSAELGQNGRQYVRKNFSWNQIVTQFESIYKRISDEYAI